MLIICRAYLPAVLHARVLRSKTTSLYEAALRTLSGRSALVRTETPVS